MAKEYTTKDGRKILGWYRRGGKAIPIIEGGAKKGEGNDKEIKGDRRKDEKKLVNVKKKEKPEWKKYDERATAENLKKGEGYSDEVKAKAKEFSKSLDKVYEKGTTKDVQNLARRADYYAKKQGIDGTDFNQYIGAVQKNAPKAKRDEAREAFEGQKAKRDTKKFVKDYYDTMMKAGKTADKVRQVGNDALWRSATASSEDDIKAWQNRSNKTEDVARFIEGREPVARIASKLIDKAKSHADEVTKDLQDSLAGDAGSVDRGLPFRTKGQESMHRKLREKSIAKGLQPEQYADKVTDALRFTDMVDADNYVGSFNKLKKGLEERGYEMVEVENTIHKKGEKYRGLNTLVESPKGYTFELQFHTPESFDVKEVNHKDYEVERRLTTPAEEKERLDKQMTERANKIQTPKGAETIQDVPRHKRKGPSDSAIRNVMEERGMTRTEAVLYLKKKNKYE